MGPLPRISVILPVLNESARICAALEALTAPRGAAAAWHEVIVADGGSTDGSREAVAAFPGCRLVTAPRGRGAQMNAGARVATGDVFLFLHVDVSLPHGAPEEIAALLRDPAVVGGAFRTWTVPDGPAPAWAFLLHLGDLRSRYTRTPYGDQAVFVRAEAFESAGRFPEIPILEDLEFSRRLRKVGRLRTAASSVRVSGRRFLARPIYYFVIMNLIPLLYALGVPPARLARLYRDVR